MSALLEVKIHPALWAGLDFDKIHSEINQEIQDTVVINAKEYTVKDPAEVHDLANSIINEHLNGYNSEDDIYFVILQGDKTLYEMYVRCDSDHGLANVYLVDVTEGLIYFKLINHSAYNARDKSDDSIFSIPLETLKDLKAVCDESLNAFVQQTNRDGDYVAVSEFIDRRTSRLERHVLETTGEWIKRRAQKLGHYELFDTVIKKLERSITSEGGRASEIKLPETFKTDEDVLGLFDSENIYIGATYVPLINVINHLKEIKPDILAILVKHAVAVHLLTKERSRIDNSIKDLKEVSIESIFKGSEHEYKIRFSSDRPLIKRIKGSDAQHCVHLRSYKLNNGTDVQVGFQTHTGTTAPFINAELIFQTSSISDEGSVICHATDNKGVLQIADVHEQLKTAGLDKELEFVLTSISTLLAEKGYASTF